MTSKSFIVVVGSDFSEHATRALQAAYEQARLRAPAELHVVHAAMVASAPVAGADESPNPAGFGDSPVSSLDELRAELVKHLDAQLSGLPDFRGSGVRVFARVLLESPIFAITRLAEALEADLIVVGSHGRHGVVRWLLGSVAEAVVRQANCQVLVVPPPSTELSPPAIEPPCTECVAVRKRTSGAEAWCEQHRERHGRRHVYFQGDRVSADGALPLVISEA
jgi:nucleotide-binding universal stress UspA family protein